MLCCRTGAIPRPGFNQARTGGGHRRAPRTCSATDVDTFDTVFPSDRYGVTISLWTQFGIIKPAP
jgi:hypothetical protein